MPNHLQAAHAQNIIYFTIFGITFVLIPNKSSVFSDHFHVRRRKRSTQMNSIIWLNKGFYQMWSSCTVGPTSLGSRRAVRRYYNHQSKEAKCLQNVQKRFLWSLVLYICDFMQTCICMSVIAVGDKSKKGPLMGFACVNKYALFAARGRNI